MLWPTPMVGLPWGLPPLPGSGLLLEFGMLQARSSSLGDGEAWVSAAGPCERRAGTGYSHAMTSPESSRKTSRGVMAAALQSARDVLDAFIREPGTADQCAALADLVTGAIRGGGKVMICGNGGSLCDAAHFAEELTGRFRNDRRPLPAIACTEAGHLTCVANDYGFEHVFSRWVTALARAGDVVIVLSTSGNSANCLMAVDAAKAAGARTAALLGKDGGALRGRCEVEIIAPGATSDRIQEVHMLVLHAVVEAVEAGL